MTRKILVILGCIISLAACAANQITTTLEATVDAAIAADSIIRPQDVPTLAIVTSCLDQAETTLASTLSPAIKATTIASECADALAASRASVPLSAVSAALSAFLRAVGVTAAQIQFSRPEMVSAFAGSSQAHVSAKALKRIRTKIEKLKKRKK